MRTSFTPGKVQEFLEGRGMYVTLEQAAGILQFMIKLVQPQEEASKRNQIEIRVDKERTSINREKTSKMDSLRKVEEKNERTGTQQN